MWRTIIVSIMTTLGAHELDDPMDRGLLDDVCDEDECEDEHEDDEPDDKPEDAGEGDEDD